MHESKRKCRWWWAVVVGERSYLAALDGLPLGLGCIPSMKSSSLKSAWGAGVRVPGFLRASATTRFTSSTDCLLSSISCCAA